MKETWKPVPYEPFSERYLISNLGRVKPIEKSRFSNNKGEFITGGLNPHGYRHVWLYHNGTRKIVFVHRMVALAFLDKPQDGFNFVCHLDDNRQNNRVDNLTWGNATINMRHMVEHRRSLVGSLNPRSLLDDDKVRTIRKLYGEGGVSQASLALKFGVDQTIISRVILRKSWKHVT